MSTMHQEQINYNLISSENFTSINWENQEKVSLTRCLHDITRTELSKCCYSLKNVNFSNLTKISNLKQLLIHCTNLKSITFNEALIDEYSQPPRQFPSSKIVHKTLSELKIIRPLNLSKHECWLLDFFTNQVDLPGIKSLSFYCFTTIGGANSENTERNPNVSRSCINLESNEVMNKYGNFDTQKTVLNFISKYQKSLQTLWIGRPGFDLGNSEPDFNNLRLTFLNVSLGSSGVNYLLQTQNHLETLNLVTKLNMKENDQSMISNMMSIFFKCIQSNLPTLQEVQIIPTLISEEFSRDDLLDLGIFNTFTVDCDLFTKSKNMRLLCLSLRAYRHEMDMWMDIPPILQGTKLLNLHNVPVTLSELYLPLEEFSLDQLEKLAAKFSQFIFLKKFYFGTSRLNVFNTFLIRSPWVKDLIYLPMIQNIVFHNGVMQDIEITRQLIDRFNNSPWIKKCITLIYTAPRYTFDFMETDCPSYDEST